MVTDLLPTTNLASNGPIGKASIWYRQNYSDAVPFTYRSGLTYEEVLETIRTWIPEYLLPYVNSNFAGFVQSFDELTVALDKALADQTARNDQRVASVTGKFLVAPAPSGGDDTAALQPLVEQAQANEGTLVLGPGTYRANLETLRAYQQPTIIGQGRYQTVLRAFTKDAPVFRFNGVSGGIGGGGIHSLGIAAAPGGGGVGLEFVGAGGTNSSDIRFSGDTSPNATGGATLPFDIGLHFNIDNAVDFCEFNTVEADFLDCNQPVVYRGFNNDSSFNGTGLVGNSTINLSEIVPFQTAITITENSLPYNAPCSVLVHGQANGQVVFNNLSTHRPASLFGTLRTEGINQVSTGSRPVWYAGTLTQLVASGNTDLGNFYLVDKILLGAGQFTDKAQFRPFSRKVPILSGQTATIVPEDVGTAIVNVDIIGPGYHYTHLLHVWDSPYSTSGVVSTLANPESLDNAGHGVPIFAFVNNSLTVRLTNNADTTDCFAFVTVSPQYGMIDPGKQNQS